MPPAVTKKKVSRKEEKESKKSAKGVGKPLKKGLSGATTQDNEESSVIGVVETKQQTIKPADQVQLTKEELKEEITIILKTEKPDIPDNVVDFSYRDMEFKPRPNTSNTFVLASCVPIRVHESVYEPEIKSQGRRRVSKDSDALEELDTKRKNKFNFCDRAIQTVIYRTRDQCVQLEPAPKVRFSATASLSEIHAAYDEQEAQKRKTKKTAENNEEKTIKKKQLSLDAQADEVSKLMDTVRIFERTVNQNIYSDVILDFSTWEDPCDEFLEQGMGSLLPLWKFVYYPMKNTAITCISWNQHYTDMFVASYGSEEFLKCKEGCACLFSLKAPAHPERVFKSEVGVHCVEFHPKQHHLFAAGYADGSVAVFNLRSKKNTSAYDSAGCRIKHSDFVSQVAWLDDNVDGQPNMASISSDGKVIRWCIVKAQLIPSEIITAKRAELYAPGPEGAHLTTTSCGTSVTFNPGSSQTFLISTEEGFIHRCSTLFSDQYLSSFKNHNNIIYNVEWNPFHPRVFLSCSADWTIRIWDVTVNDSVFMFDMFTEVRDVRWAPFSSSLFAAVCKDNKVYLFDLAMNRQLPTCSYLIHKPQKNIFLTKVLFNPNKPLLAVGDERGNVHTFKLSPNLRTALKGMESLERTKFVAGEIDKMEKILKLAKSPDEK